jgi:hypothetical protein
MTMRDDLTALAEEMTDRGRREATILRAILESHPEPPAPPVAQAMPTRRELADVFMRAHMAWRLEHGDLYLQVADQVLALLAAQESAAPVVSEIQRRWGIEGDESDVDVCERLHGSIKDVVARAESAELGCEIAYKREPTQAEGDAHEAGEPAHAKGECFVAMGGFTGRRCRVCSRWTWGGPTACEACVAKEDRDEWKAQHENALACWKRDNDAMRDELAELRRGMEAACYAYEISNTDGPLDDVMESWIKRLGLFSKPASGHDLDLPPRAGWDANGSPVDAEDP